MLYWSKVANISPDDRFDHMGGDSLALISVTRDLANVGVSLRIAAAETAITFGWLERQAKTSRIKLGSEREQALCQPQVGLKTFELMPLRLEYLGELISVFCDTFVGREPLAVAAGLQPDTFRQFAAGWCRSLADVPPASTLSFVAIDGGQIVAFTLNEIFDPCGGEPDVPTEMAAIFTLLAELDEIYFTSIGGMPAPNSAMHMVASGSTRPGLIEVGTLEAVRSSVVNLFEVLQGAHDRPPITW